MRDIDFDFENTGYKKMENYNEIKTLKIAAKYKDVLKELGEDSEREGLQKTPERVAKAMQFLTQVYHANPSEIL